jgi:hypothetical protein
MDSQVQRTETIRRSGCAVHVVLAKVPELCDVFQVGCFFEFYRSQAKKIARWLRLKPGRFRRLLGRGVGIGGSLARPAEVAKSSGSPVVIIGQQSRPAGGTLLRRPVMLIMSRTRK